MTTVVNSTASWLTLQQAAEALALSVPQVRRRVQSGKLRGRREPFENGWRWLVDVHNIPTVEVADSPLFGNDNLNGAVTSTFPEPNGKASDSTAPPPPQAWQDMVQLLDRLTRENRDLAGQVGYLQAQVQAREEIRALAAPARRRRWWWPFGS